MIVRILGEGQLSVPDAEMTGLNELDDALGEAVESGDETLSGPWRTPRQMRRRDAVPLRAGGSARTSPTGGRGAAR